MKNIYYGPVTHVGGDASGVIGVRSDSGPIVGSTREPVAIAGGNAIVSDAGSGGSSGEQTRGQRPQRAWVDALVAGVAALLIVIPVFTNPFSRWAWMPMVVALTMGVGLYLRRANRYYRSTALCLSIAAGSAMVPGLSAAFDIQAFGRGSLVVESSPFVAVIFVLASIVFGVLDYRENRN